MNGFKRILEAYDNREHVYFMDEAVFSCGQVAPKIWYLPQSRPVFLPKKKIGFGAIAVAAAINCKGEVVAWHIQDKSIDSAAFEQFLGHLKDHIGRKKAVLMLDNLQVHRTNNVQTLARKFGIELVYNGTYSSEFMPIERLWAWAKRRFTRICADNAPYHNQSAMRRLVKDVLLQNYEQGLQKRIAKCIKMMREWLEMQKKRPSLQSQIEMQTNAAAQEEIKTTDIGTSREPNVIGTLDPANLAALNQMPGFNFNQFLLPEELKQNNGNTKLTLDQFTRKVHSKHHLLFALSVKGQLHLPEPRFCTMDFLRGVLNGRKSCFTNTEIRKVKVPRYKQLTLDKVLAHCITQPRMLRYLPNMPANGEPPCDRDFLFSVVNTIDPEYFPSQMRRIEQEKRDKAVNQDHDVIEVRPEIMSLLEAFDAPVKSQSKGSQRALCMLKANAKKRTRKEFEESSATVGKRPREGPGLGVKRTKLSK